MPVWSSPAVRSNLWPPQRRVTGPVNASAPSSRGTWARFAPSSVPSPGNCPATPWNTCCRRTAATWPSSLQAPRGPWVSSPRHACPWWRSVRAASRWPWDTPRWPRLPTPSPPCCRSARWPVRDSVAGSSRSSPDPASPSPICPAGTVGSSWNCGLTRMPRLAGTPTLWSRHRTRLTGGWSPTNARLPHCGGSGPTEPDWQASHWRNRLGPAGRMPPSHRRGSEPICATSTACSPSTTCTDCPTATLVKGACTVASTTRWTSRTARHATSSSSRQQPSWWPVTAARCLVSMVTGGPAPPCCRRCTPPRHWTCSPVSSTSSTRTTS